MKIPSLGHTLIAWLLLSVVVFSNPAISAETTGTIPANTAESATAEAIALEDPASKAAVRDLVAQLNDDAVRALLIQRLDAVAEAKEQSDTDDRSALDVVASSLIGYFSRAKSAIFNAASINQTFTKTAAYLQSDIGQHSLMGVAGLLVLAIIIGICAERVVVFFFRKRKQQLIDAVAYTLGGILRILYTRLSFDILGILAFSLASSVTILSTYDRGNLVGMALYTITSGLAATGMAFVISRFFFAPGRPDLRICRTTDARAWRLTITYSLLAGYIVFIHNFFGMLVTISMTEGQGYMWSLAYFMNVSMYLAAAFVIWYNRHSLTEVLLENKKRITLTIGDGTEEISSWFATHWPKIAIVLIALKYFLVELVVNSTEVGRYSTTAVYITLTLIFLWPGVDANITLFVGRGIPVPDDETPAAAKARRSMQQGLLRVGRVIIVGLTAFFLAKLWGLNLLSLAESGLGAQLAGNLLEILLVVLFTYICWELLSIVIDYWLAQEGGAAGDQESDGGGEIGGVGLSRVATILPIIQKTAKFLIVIVAIIMILDNWGVNIAPILAGAGVLGLAIGFGAQTLVKDIVSGMFFLADDAFRVGEYIAVDGTMGNVEKISLRSLRLRHHRGLVHTIPYGEIPKLTNYSRDWVIMKLRFKVPFDTDVNKVKKIFKQIGKDLLEHPELGEDFLQPFKSQGVAEVDDNGLVVRGKFMAKPGKQFMIRKEVYVRVQKALEEAGIPFARKQVMVHIPGLENDAKLDANDAKAIGAAAAEAVEEELLPEGQAKKPAS